MNYPGDTGWIERTESRLANLDAVCFLLTVSEPFVADRLALRLRASGKPRDSAHVESATREFLDQQEELVRASERALVPTVLLSTDDRDWERCSRSILDRLEERVG